jgi:hypothetical protein
LAGKVGALWVMGGISRVSYLRWLWHEERSVARVLAVGVATLLVCAPGIAVSEAAVVSTVQVAQPQRPAIIHLGPGTYEISQNIADEGFPADSTVVTVTGPRGQVPARDISPAMTLADPAGVFLGAWDCHPVVSFTIPQAGYYQVSIKDQYGMNAAWISEPYGSVARQVFPWCFGVVASLLTIALCLAVPRARWRLMRQVAPTSASGHPRLQAELRPAVTVSDVWKHPICPSWSAPGPHETGTTQDGA